MRLRPIVAWSLFSAGCFGSAALTYTLLVPHSPSAVPAGFTIDPVELDLGTLVQGQVGSRGVSIINTTNRTWTVHRVLPSCGCSTGNVSLEVLPPGSTSSLQISFDSTGKFDLQKHMIRIEMYCDETPVTWETITVPITAHVVLSAWAEPDGVTLIDCELGKTVAFSVTLHCAQGRIGRSSPRLADVPGAALNEFKMRPSQPLHEGTNELLVEFCPKQSAGQRVLNLPIDPGIDGCPPVEFKFSARVKSEFRVEPADVMLGSLKSGETKAVTVRINGGSSPLDIAECPPYLEATISGTPGAQVSHLTTLPEKLTPRTILRDTVRLKTGSLTEPMLGVRVLAVVGEAESRPAE